MKTISRFILFIVLFAFTSCGKDFLDIRREANQVVPSAIQDYQALLDSDIIFTAGAGLEMGMIGSDEYNILDGRWTNLSASNQRNGYIWAKEVYEGAEVSDWNWAYQRILYANMALEVERVIPGPNEIEAWNNVKGSALFHRAHGFYRLAQLFCKPYSGSAASDPGIPLRLDYDVSKKVGRGTLKDVYERILKDLLDAVNLLPEKGINQYRPNKAAAYLLLARTCLQMDDFKNAEHYANLGLLLNSYLLDYNLMNLNTDFIFPTDYGKSNLEVLFFGRTSLTILSPARFNVDPSLLKLYKEYDLRKSAYSKEMPDGRITFNGSYSGMSGYFTGLATDELWLVRAEGKARNGNSKGAMEDLNHLLKHRYHKDYFVPLVATTKGEALSVILTERRKELFMRGVRWEDQRRLNKESAYSTTWVRKIDGQQFELSPTSNRWVWPIPDNEIILNNLEQNPR